MQEEGNRVREIPSENNGGIVEKLYSTEPTWLDRYRIENSDEEQTEEGDEEDEVYPGSDMHSRLQTLRS